MQILTYVPQNLDLEQLALHYPVDELPTKKRSIEYLYWFCGTLVSVRHKHLYRIHKEEYTHLCAQYLRLIHQNYNEFMAYLFDAGVIIPDESYKAGEKCTGYRFADAYQSQIIKTVEITNLNLKKAIMNYRGLIEEERYPELRPYKAAYRSYLTYQLTIDELAALNWINAYYQKSLKELDAQGYTVEELAKQQDILKTKCNAMFIFTDKIVRKDYGIMDFIPCKAGRLHGMFTRNKKELRHFTKYAGEHLVSMDIKNSQPYLTTLLLNPDFWRSKKVKTGVVQLHKIAPDIYKELREEGVIRRIIMLLKSSESLAGIDFTTSRYMNLAVSGGIYEHLLAEMPKRLSEEFKERYGYKIENRDAIKKQMLFVMYSRNYPVKTTGLEIIEVFQQMFPFVAKLFALIKGRGKSYKRFARILQSVESYLVLQVVCKNLAKKYPQLPIFTIHDCIVTTVGNQDKVQAEIDAVFTQLVGIAPKVQPEFWLPENAFESLKSNSYICENLNEIEFEEIESL